MAVVWDDPLVLDKLERQREERGGRQLYDCFNCHARADRAICVKGHQIGPAKDGAIILVAVLRGHTPRLCQVCPDFEG